MAACTHSELPRPRACTLIDDSATISERPHQVEQTRARRERDQLLGKVEAALWRKDPEADPPMGLSTMTTSELQEVLAKLNGERTPNPKADKS